MVVVLSSLIGSGVNFKIDFEIKLHLSLFKASQRQREEVEDGLYVCYMSGCIRSGLNPCGFNWIRLSMVLVLTIYLIPKFTLSFWAKSMAVPEV